MHLDADAWTFGFDNAKTRGGQCNHTTKRITVSRHLASRFDDDEIHQVLLHEVAHAIAGPAAGHGPKWRSVARELGPQGITVNAISPGPIDTDIMGGTLTEERKQKMAADGVLPRIGTPRDIAAAIAYLISEDAGYVTGQTLNVDGGLYMH